MKLHNHTLRYLSVALFPVIAVWAVVFYFNMLDEIYDSIDDGLENSELLIIEHFKRDHSIALRDEFLESNYQIHPISVEAASRYKTIYFDSLLYMVNEKDYEPVRVLKTSFKAGLDHYELIVFSSMVEEDDLVEDLFYAIIWLYIILIVSVLIINNWLLRKIWKPFYDIVDNLRNFKLDESQFNPAAATKVTEFNQLNDAVNELLLNNLETFHNQKQFIENASHELQTPLAISINRLELLAEKSILPENEMAELGAVVLTLERLTRLNKTLLLISKIDNRQFPSIASIHITECCRHVVNELSDLAEFREVEVSVIEERSETVEANPELFSTLITNLVKNGIVHNYPGGAVQIQLNDSCITVENTSRHGELDASRIFDRFYKGSASGTASSGLGLSLARSIAHLYGWEIGYHFDGRKHSFSIHLH
ncbi:MAG: HAMP domain-containing sensor histidine kinase [Bacteroidota bacterium]